MISLLLLLVAVGAQAQGYKDVTGYIQNADQAASGGWTYTRQTTGGETKTWSAVNKAYSGSYDSEIYAGETLGYTTFSATQTITLPRGTYHLIGKAFKRDVPSVVLFAETGGQRSAVEVVSVYWQFSSTTPTDKSPSTMDAAAKAFNGNMYLNDLAFTVETDETEVTIGYAGEFTAARQWFIFGAMNLYQVQDEVSTAFPVDVTPSLNRSRESYTGLTGRYANADVYIHEKYSGSNFPVGDLVYQTFAGLENGIYEVVINANASKANGVGTLPSADPYVYAGGTTATVHAVEQSAVSTVGEYVLNRVTVTDGTLRVGLYNQAEGGNWALFNVKSMKYCGVDLTALVESYEELLATAKALQVQDKVMQQTVKAELDEAIAAAETDVNTDSREWLETIISRLSAAISRAQESILLYEGDILLAVNGMKAQSTSDDVRTAFQARYDQPRVASIDIPLHDTEATLTLTAVVPSAATSWQSFTVPAGSVVYDLPNLLPQCTYYYKVEAEGETIASGTINTGGHLRMMKAEGIANMRDLGGWLTTDGLRLRYGKLYRGSELAAGKTYTATEADLAMLKALDVAAEIDLREDIDFAAGNMSVSAIDGATYYYANLSRWSEDALNLDTERFKAAYHTMLTALKAGHAAYFHCIFGADRTGCFAFLTEGLLGLPVDQLYKDYELTSFSTAGLREKAGIDHKLQYIRNLPGASLQEQFFNYWRGAVGISDADLLDFISIMTDGESTITTTPPQPLWSTVLPPTVPDGEYYLYLPTYGQFLGRGLNWGTRAACDNYGVPATLRTNGVGVTTIQYLDNNLYLGSDGYADKAANFNTVSWHAEQHDGHLVLKSHNGLYLAMSDNGSLADGGSSAVSVVGGFAADIASATPIELKTAEEQKALVAATHHASTIAAFQAAGIDMADTDDPETVLAAAGYTAIEHAAAIGSATTGSTTEWVLSEPYAHGETENYGNAYNVGDYGGELYQKNGTVSQTITVPQAGLYRLTLNALYRQGTNADCYAIGQKGYELSNAYVSISEPSAPLGSPEQASTSAPLGSPGQAVYFAQIPSWYSGCAGSDNPNTTDEAKALMQAGRYAVELYAYIGESRQATITVSVPNFTSRGWCLFNNFALTAYVGSEYTGIADAVRDKPADTPCYDLSGRRVARFHGTGMKSQKKGVYIPVKRR